ncbi:7TM-DISM domain-containing protein, partial [Achromobacter xylosoxidans]|uniref:7TM-DISM domain-containing protein n=1 Tax=Alcaligenes xylosoxydans xylosoxydans TaxID=85698 RepID=UPI0023EA5CE7
MPDRRVGWLAWLLWLALSCLSLPARGQDPQPVIDLSTVGGTLPLVGELRGIEDHAGDQDASQVLDGAWQPVTARWLNRGYSASAFWLRLEVSNTSGSAQERWLSFGVPRLEDVRFYLFAPGQRQPSGILLAGNREPLARREIPATVSVVPLRLEPGQRMTVLVRVQSRSAISMEPTLRTPAAFVGVTQRNTMVVALLIGALMMVGLYAAVLGAAQRDPVYLLLSAAIFIEILYSLSFQGLLYRYVLTGGGQQQV